MNNKKYNMHKFRSMKNATSKEKSPAFVTEEEARILNPIGRIIRKTRMDELPQFWDVLIGNMSIIGPRPEQPRFVEQFSDELPFYEYRHHVRPGITGWAQVNFSYAATLEETAKKLEYDLYYVKNWSMLLDLSIILKTIETMLGMRGAK
jgi:lipopolysaccharide/colanic/teichoic acid biosynthesis glycosyltransferase